MCARAGLVLREQRSESGPLVGSSACSFMARAPGACAANASATSARPTSFASAAFAFAFAFAPALPCLARLRRRSRRPRLPSLLPLSPSPPLPRFSSLRYSLPVRTCRQAVWSRFFHKLLLLISGGGPVPRSRRCNPAGTLPGPPRPPQDGHILRGVYSACRESTAASGPGSPSGGAPPAAGRSGRTGGLRPDHNLASVEPCTPGKHFSRPEESLKKQQQQQQQQQQHQHQHQQQHWVQHGFFFAFACAVHRSSPSYLY